MLAAQRGKNLSHIFTDEMLNEYAEYNDEPHEKEGGGDLSHRFIPFIIHSRTHVLRF